MNFQESIKIWSNDCPQDAKKVESYQGDRIQFCVTDTGEMNLKEDGIFFHSKKSAIKEAEDWFKTLDSKTFQVLYHYGVGLAYSYEAVQNWLKSDRSHFIIYLEDDLEVIHRLFETEKGKELLQNPQVKLYWIDFDHLNEDFFDQLTKRYTGLKCKFSTLECYKNKKRTYSFKINQLLKYYNDKQSYIEKEMMRHGLSFFGNYYRNLFLLPNTYRGEYFFDKFKKIPAIICGAGPSLKKNVHLIKDLKDKALIFAGGTAMNAINSEGILPHFGVGVDPNRYHLARIITNQAYETPFFYRGRMFHPALKQVHGNKIHIPGSVNYDIGKWIEKQLGIEGKEITSGSNVVNFAIAIAEAMGCSPIILIGVDLAYSEGESYSSGIFQHPLHDPRVMKEKSEKEEMITAKDIFGKPIKTLWKWLRESAWIAQSAYNAPHMNLINATEGGIGFPGVPNMTLKEVSKKYLNREYDFDTWIHGLIQNGKMPKDVTISKILETLDELKESLKRCFDNIESLNQDEPAYQAILKQFNDYYFEAFQKRYENIESQILLERFRFLKKTAQVHYNLIKIIHSEQKEDLIATPQKIEYSEDGYHFENGIFSIEDQELGISYRDEFKPEEKKDIPNMTQWLKEGKLHGPSMFGQLAKCWYINGVKQGKAWYFYPSGSLASLQRYMNGSWHGKQEFFYSNGTLKSLLNYSEGKLHGEVILFYQNGHQKRKFYYQNGKRDGIEEMWNRNGTKTVEVEYHQNLPTGVAKEWYDNGSLTAEIRYDKKGVQTSIKRWNRKGIPIDDKPKIPKQFLESLENQARHLQNSLKHVMGQFKDTNLQKEIDELNQTLEKIKSYKDGNLEEEIEAISEKMSKLIHSIQGALMNTLLDIKKKNDSYNGD